MEQRIKIIIIALAGALVISLLINLQVYTTKQASDRERDILKKENISLAQKADDNLRNNRQLENKINSLTDDLERISKEKEEIQQKYGLACQERDELTEKINNLSSAAPTKIEQPLSSSVPQDAYWADVLKQKTDLELQLNSIRRDLRGIQAKNEEMQKDKQGLELDIKTLNQENQDLKRQVEYNQKVMDSLAQESVREKSDKFQIQNSLKEIKAENGFLKRQLKSLSSRKVILEKKLRDIQARNSQLEDSVAATEANLQTRLWDMDNLKRQIEEQPARAAGSENKFEDDSVELPPIIVRPQAPLPAPEAAGEIKEVAGIGKITAINRDNNFVIIDIGEDNDVKIGDAFGVYRQNQPIATIEAIQVRGEISACDIKNEGSPINVGDVISK